MVPHPLLRVVALRKTYATPQGPLAVLKGIDLSLNAGSSLALMGEFRQREEYPLAPHRCA